MIYIYCVELFDTKGNLIKEIKLSEKLNKDFVSNVERFKLDCKFECYKKYFIKLLTICTIVSFIFMIILVIFCIYDIIYCKNKHKNIISKVNIDSDLSIECYNNKYNKFNIFYNYSTILNRKLLYIIITLLSIFYILNIDIKDVIKYEQNINLNYTTKIENLNVSNILNYKDYYSLLLGNGDIVYISKDEVNDICIFNSNLLFDVTYVYSNGYNNKYIMKYNNIIAYDNAFNVSKYKLHTDPSILKIFIMEDAYDNVNNSYSNVVLYKYLILLVTIIFIAIFYFSYHREDKYLDI